MHSINPQIFLISYNVGVKSLSAKVWLEWKMASAIGSTPLWVSWKSGEVGGVLYDRREVHYWEAQDRMTSGLCTGVCGVRSDVIYDTCWLGSGSVAWGGMYSDPLTPVKSYWLLWHWTLDIFPGCRLWPLEPHECSYSLIHLFACSNNIQILGYFPVFWGLSPCCCHLSRTAGGSSAAAVSAHIKWKFAWGLQSLHVLCHLLLER